VPAPACGDGTVNQPSEACDGADAPDCPGECAADCTCALPPPVAVVEADAAVHEREPDRALGTTTLLWADADTAKRSFLRVRVSGVGNRTVTRARLVLQVPHELTSESITGGMVRAASSCAWSESAITWRNQPAVGGPVLASAGVVAPGDIVAFDVTAALVGDGVYCFALESGSADGVIYSAREAGPTGPTVEVATDP
jgi:hypothetical protein